MIRKNTVVIGTQLDNGKGSALAKMAAGRRADAA